MVGRTPHEAWLSYIAPLREALRCVSPGRFVLRDSPSGLQEGQVYSVTLNNMNSVPLKGANQISLRAGQTIGFEQSQPAHRQERFHVVPLAYTYGFTIVGDRGEQELLTFHWNRLATPFGALPRGHLHIGPGLFATPTVVRPSDFHRAHVPTGELHFAAVVRFAIAELGVTPLVDEWAAILSRADDAFGQ